MKGEDGEPRAFLFLGSFSVYVIFHLYRITVLPVSAKMGLTQKKWRDGEAREGIPGHKRFTSARPEPVFQAWTIHAGEEDMEQDRQGQMGEDEHKEGEDWWHTTEKYTLFKVKLFSGAILGSLPLYS